MGHKLFVHFCGPDEMERVIQRRSDQIVHSRIDNNEFFTAPALDIKDASEHYPCVGADALARLKNEFDVFIF